MIVKERTEEYTDCIINKFNVNNVISDIVDKLTYYGERDFEDIYESVNIITSPKVALEIFKNMANIKGYSIWSMNYSSEKDMNSNVIDAYNVVLYPNRYISIEPVSDINGKIYNIFDSAIYLDTVNLSEPVQELIKNYIKGNNDITLIERENEDDSILKKHNSNDIVIHYSNIIQQNDKYKCAVTVESRGKEVLSDFVKTFVDIFTC